MKKNRPPDGYTVTTIGKQEFQRIEAEHEEHAQSRKEQVQRDAADISKRERKGGRYAIGDAFLLLLAANKGKSVKLGLAIDNGEIPCYEPEDAVPKDVSSLGYETTDEVHCDDLNKWISENYRLLDYRFPNPSAAPVVTPNKHTIKRRTWRDVALPYVVATFKTGNFTTAKALYAAIDKRAGTDSPFERGTGDNRGTLVVRELSKTVSIKTMQNAWAEIKAQR